MSVIVGAERTRSRKGSFTLRRRSNSARVQTFGLISWPRTLAHEIALERQVALKLLLPSSAAERKKRKWFRREARTAAKLFHPNIVPIHGVEQAGGFVFFIMEYVLAALYRKTDRTRSAMQMNRFALLAWTVRVFNRAADAEINVAYDRQAFNEDFMRELVRLSWFDDGPRLAREFLAKHGIQLVIEPQLPRTRLDGAAIMSEAGWPVVALTIRHDRIDNFWFSLVHELVHVMAHLGDSNSSFYDDLDAEPSDDALESEADRLARDLLISADEWENSAANLIPSHDTVVQLAGKLRIHPAIVAGRARYDGGNFKILHGLVGYGGVRLLFPEIEW